MRRMYLVAIGWLYVVLMMSAAEAMSPQGTVLGAVITFVLYGALPLAVLLYILDTPARKRRLKARELANDDRGGHAPGAAVAPERKEP